MHIVGFDTETTGLANGSRMVEIAAIIYDTESQTTINGFHSLVNPDMPIPEYVTKIHGITNEMVANAPKAEEVIPQFFEALPEGAELVAHNAPYDVGVVSWDAKRVGINIDPAILVHDTLSIAKAIKETRSNKLETLMNHYRIHTDGPAHRAISDANGCLSYFNLMADRDHGVSPDLWNTTGYTYEYFSDFPDLLSDIPMAVCNAEKYDFCYVDAQGNASDREIIPHGWYAMGDHRYIQGWCLYRNDYRTFRMDRIQGV